MKNAKTKKGMMKNINKIKQKFFNNSFSKSSKISDIHTAEHSKTMFTTFCSFFNATTKLQFCLIHDEKSNVRVCNNYSKHLFIKFRNARFDEFFFENISDIKIEC